MTFKNFSLQPVFRLILPINLGFFALGPALFADFVSPQSSVKSLLGDPPQEVPGLVAMIVDKTGLTADLQIIPPNNQAPRLVGSFKIAVGKELGDKFKTGTIRPPKEFT